MGTILLLYLYIYLFYFLFVLPRSIPAWFAILRLCFWVLWVFVILIVCVLSSFVELKDKRFWVLGGFSFLPCPQNFCLLSVCENVFRIWKFCFLVFFFNFLCWIKGSKAKSLRSFWVCMDVTIVCVCGLKVIVLFWVFFFIF